MSGLQELLRDPRLASPAASLLLLDYDGTLAPLVAERDEAVPYHGIREALEQLPGSGPGRFVVVSGRTCLDVGRRLALATVYEVWGCHGAQRQLPGEPPETMSPSPMQQAALRRATVLALQAFPGIDLEHKPTGLALHVRRLPEEAGRQQMEQLAPAWSELAARGCLELHPFNGGLELRLPGLHKGLAVQTLAMEEPGAVMVFLGDDLTDEDAFRALGSQGIGVLVRPEFRPTAADYWIRPPEDLLHFLAFWRRFTRNGSPPGDTP